MIAEYTVDVREPYMGNIVPIRIRTVVRNGTLIRVEVTGPDGISMEAQRVSIIEKEGNKGG